MSRGPFEKWHAKGTAAAAQLAASHSIGGARECKGERDQSRVDHGCIARCLLVGEDNLTFLVEIVPRPRVLPPADLSYQVWPEDRICV